MPWARSPFVWSICRMLFFFTIPNSTSMPSIEKMLSDWLSITSDSSANGTVMRQRQQDRDRVEPALELRRQDQVHEDDRQQERDHEALRALPCSRDRPVKP